MQHGAEAAHLRPLGTVQCRDDVRVEVKRRKGLVAHCRETQAAAESNIHKRKPEIPHPSRDAYASKITWNASHLPLDHAETV